jgi:hypothetical protein
MGVKFKKKIDRKTDTMFSYYSHHFHLISDKISLNAKRTWDTLEPQPQLKNKVHEIHRKYFIVEMNSFNIKK